MDTTGSGIDHERLDALRRDRGPIQEHIIDEFVAGNISRRDFLTKATAFGMSIPLAGSILDAVEGRAPRKRTAHSRPAASVSHKWNGKLNAGMIIPAGAVNPLTIEDQGGLEIIGNIGDFLVDKTNSNTYRPQLATKWKSNKDATVWTFTIRKGVKFNNGKTLTADDVVYSFKQNCDPKNSGNALSVFGGTLKPDGVVKKSADEVEFHLEQSDVEFIDATTSDNYNMIIVPHGYDYASYDKKPANFVGTGPFKVSAFNASTGATLVRNPHYWGKPAKAHTIHLIFYTTETPMASALEGNNIDCLDQFTVSTSPQLLNHGQYNIVNLDAATHREASMRCDRGYKGIPKGAPYAFSSKYVRQALAYCIDRKALVDKLFHGYATVGNDSPFCKVFPQTVGAKGGVPQREQDFKKAKDLLKKGGHPRGFKANLYTEQLQEMQDYVTLMASWAKKIGIDLNLHILPQDTYYGKSYTDSPWLDGEVSVVDYGARSVPNLYLEAPLQTYDAKTGQGAWNAAHFNNSKYDKLSKEYIAAINLPSQRKLAKEIELLLLDETPIIFAYFYNYLQASRKNCHGVLPTAQGQYFLQNAYLT